MTQSSSSQWQKAEKKAKNFECPCGKTYLSYPALYTHIKQAHGGKAPGQIKRPDSQNRGRPKRSEALRLEEHKRLIEQGLKNDPMPELLALVSGAQACKNRQVRQIYSHQPVFRLIMNDKEKAFEPPFLKQDRIHDVRMGQGIIQFLKQIQGIIQDKNVYDQIIMLIVLLTEHIIEQTEDQNVLSLGTIGLMPQFVNYFMIHDFRKPLQRLKLQGLWIFQGQNAIRLLNIFFKWMLYRRFTTTQVQVNERYFQPENLQLENNNPVQHDSYSQQSEGQGQQAEVGLGGSGEQSSSSEPRQSHKQGPQEKQSNQEKQ